MKRLFFLVALATILLTACAVSGESSSVCVAVACNGSNTTPPALPANDTAMPPAVAVADFSATTEMSSGSIPVISLQQTTGQILTVKPTKEWDPTKPNSCASLHFAPVRSTAEGGPEGESFEHKMLETRCLNPGTDLFDTTNVGNGFYEVSIAVADVHPYAYNLMQKLALSTVARTTDGAWVIRAFVYYTDKYLVWRNGPPAVSLNPFKSIKDRKEYEKKRQHEEFVAPPKGTVSNLYQGDRRRSLFELEIGNGLPKTCKEGILKVHLWDFGSLPHDLQQVVLRAEEDGRRGFKPEHSFSSMYGARLRKMGASGDIRLTSKNPPVRVSIINPDGTEGEWHSLTPIGGKVWAKFSPHEVPNGSMVRIIVPEGNFLSPSVAPSTQKREIRLTSWQGNCTMNMHTVVN